MRDLTAAVVDAIHMAGFVEIEVSAKHVHLTQEDVEVLFGKGPGSPGLCMKTMPCRFFTVM